MVSRGLAFLLAFGVVGSTSPLFAQAALQARFDWSMPDRFGHDLRTLGGGSGPDGVPDYWITFQDTWSGIDAGNPEAGSPAINPPSWQVVLDAGASKGDIYAYRWKIDGAELPARKNPSLAHDFPAEGKYTVTLTVADAKGNTAETTREVTVQDWLIVAVGDSYASGEGNPEVGGMDLFAEVASAYGDLQAATLELNRALQALRDAELGYQLTHADIQPALQALNTWNAECPSIRLACVNATANLTRELVRLGFREVSELITKGFQYVRTQIENLLRTAEAAVNAARAGASAAQAVVEGVQAQIEFIVKKGATWQTRPDVADDGASHRSSLSGQALAALALERADPRTSVTFVHLAYSGAKIRGNGSVLVSNDGSAQLDHVKRLVGEREIDALLVSIGGNDAGFASIMTSLVFSEPEICAGLRTLADARCRLILDRLGLPAAVSGPACAMVAERFEGLCHEGIGRIDQVPKQDHRTLLREGLAALPGNFAALADFLERPGSFPDLPPRRLYFTEYPNLTEGDDGSLCPNFLTVTTEDWRWVRDTMTVGLNTTIGDEVARHGWSLVGGIFDGFHGHGYCAADHWVIHPEESFLIQGDHMGMAHPTAAGHRVYGDVIARRLLADLYTAGDLSRPRAPGYGPRFRRGDSNGDGGIDISDPIHLLGWLFLGEKAPPCIAAVDANGEGRIDISDAVYLLSFLFTGGQDPVEPFRDCGPLQGAADESLGCAAPSGGCS